jgi:hypothetical protein
MLNEITRGRIRVSLGGGLLSLALTAVPALGLSWSATQDADPVQDQATQESLPDARDVIGKHLRAIGHSEKTEAIKSVHTTGNLKIIGMGIGGTMEVYQARPNLFFTVNEMEGIGVIKSGYDGKVGWMDQPMLGEMLLEGFTFEQIRSTADFGARYYDASLYEKAETVAKVEFEGQQCYKVWLVQTPYESDDKDIADKEKSLKYRESYHYFAVETGLLAGSTQLVSTMMGDMPSTEIIQDYKQFGDLLMASKVLQKVPGMTIETTTESVVFDKVDVKIFELPKKILALLPLEDEDGQ